MNQTADAKINDLASSLPPRYRWLKRLAAGLGLFFAFVFVLRLWWGHEAHRRLQAEIQRIRAAGEPIFPSDFNPTEIFSSSKHCWHPFCLAHLVICFEGERRICCSSSSLHSLLC